MWLDCAIIGGGPAGLNAALVLGRSRRWVMLFDHNKSRNRVTQRSHGFITRDGIEPAEFRRLAHRDIEAYPSVAIKQEAVVRIAPIQPGFIVETGNGTLYQARTIILAAGLKETLPAIPGIHSYYGKSLFSCPYCDGWEQRDKPLAVITEGANAFNLAKMVYNWSRDILICTNGKNSLSAEQISFLNRKGISYYTSRIAELKGQDGLLSGIRFDNGMEAQRAGGFVSPQWEHSSAFGEALGCSLSPEGGYMTDHYGRTTVPGVYAAGDSSMVSPSQVIIAAGEGSKAAIGVNIDLTNQDFFR